MGDTETLLLVMGAVIFFIGLAVVADFFIKLFKSHWHKKDE
jgi:hypothetical protein